MVTDFTIRLKVVHVMNRIRSKNCLDRKILFQAIKIFDLYYIYVSALKLTGDEEDFTDSNYIMSGLASLLIA